MTAAAGTTAAAARDRALLLATRASYGVALVMAPSALIRVATGRSPGRGTRRVAQVLGARHLIQAAVSAFAPMPAVLAAGAAVDGLHAGSMIMLAISDRDARRVALTDALAEALFAAAGRRASTINEELFPRVSGHTVPNRTLTPQAIGLSACPGGEMPGRGGCRYVRGGRPRRRAQYAIGRAGLHRRPRVHCSRRLLPPLEWGTW